MSKAFTKEDSNSETDDSLEAQDTALPTGTKNYITPQGAEKLKSELRRLLNEERPALVNTIAWAASNGDRSENADYIYGKRRLREIDRRVGFLNKRLDAAEVIDPSQQKSDKVLFGATVKVQDEEDRTRTYRIVGIDETDIKAGKISWRSPIGKALLQHQAGDVVVVQTPRGEEELEIISISYVEIP